MAPTESHHGMIPVMGTQVPLTGTIPLSALIEFIIQRTYQDLSILSELLPRKTDMERKIEIVQFASRTCQLFVRLLALVKWASSASKVDKCAIISNFLDQQAKLFEKTADSLAVMARETLTHARLPSFSLPCAVDVLTTGSYPRLPSCIKEKIVPPDPITPQEKWQTLMRLNQIIEHRLVTSDLPKHMRRPQIQNGRVSFQVEHEFEVTLTLMGDGANIPWRLLLIEILVEDPETGDGKSLVHSLQVNYLHQLVQMRIMDSKKPLHDLYNCLHSFCQSLQLEVLHSQTQQLMRQRLGDHIHIEEYKAGERLVISYWRDLMRKENKSYSSSTFKLSVHMDTNDPSRPLQITHFPLIHGTESLKVAQAIKSDYLSIERLLVHTIHVRSLAKLKELQRELRPILSGLFKISDLPLVLYVPVITPCMDSEKICVSVHMQKGTFLISVCRTETSLTADIEDSLNGDRRDLRKLLSRLRLSLVLSRCAKSIQHLQVATSHHLPLVNLSGHPLEKLGKHKLFIKLAKQSDYYMVVEAFESGWMSVDFNHYLMHVTPTGFEGAASEGEGAEDSLCVYLRAGYFMQLDTYLCTHGPCSQLQELEEEEPDPLSRKRKMFMKDQYGRHTKKQKCSPYFVPELCHILALCEDRIPFVALADELLKQGIPHQGLQVDGDGAALCLTLVDVLSCPSLKDNEAVQLMRADLLSCKFRKAGRVWKVESVVANCPLQSTNSKEQGVIQRVYFEYELQGSETMEKIVESLQEDWLAVCHLYQVVSDFAHIYAESPALQAGIEVKAFTYKRLTLAYGPNKCYTVSIQYRPNSKQFQLAYGTCCKSSVANCHSMVSVQLENLLNDSRSIALLAQILVDTWSPLSSVGKLNTSPLMGLGKMVSALAASFIIVPQSPVHIRLIFRNLYCIDIHCHRGNEVTLRDGAYSMFDTSKVVEGLNPTPGLKAFLNMYVDETVSSGHIRHQSTTEDDNPPSPIGIDTLDSLLTQPLSNSPVGPRKQDSGGLRFQSPITPPSNPHTPASPSTQRHGQTHSSPAAASFPMASPPSMTHGVAPSPSNIMAPSPNNPALHVPSPSAFVPAPSPQSLGIHMPSPATQFISPQGMLEGVGSPFASGSTQLAMPSPGARNWPASPSMPGPSPVSRPGGMLSPVHTALHSPQTQLKDDYQKGSLSMLPSRMLPQRSWAGSIPTILTHEALNKLLSPSFPPGGGPMPGIRCCPLERFLCCMYQRKFLQRTIQTEDSLQMMQCSEPGVLMFKTDQLQFRVSLNPNTLQSLHLTVTPTPECQHQWELDELQILERFFDLKVACPPYKINTLVAFSSRIMCLPPNILKDFIKIMRMELLPDRSLKWSVQWCLTVPIGISYPVGVPAVTLSNNKVLFMIQLTRIGVAMPPGVEPQNIVIPILYDHSMNTTQVMEQRSQELSQSTVAVSNMLKRFIEFNPNPNGCSIYPALRELLTNLVVPMQGMNQPQ